MRCSRIHKRSSAFLDGDMTAEEMAAIRGHLRTCEACSELIEAERELVQAAGELEQPEPPASLWASIQERIAEEEIAASEQPAWRIWWSGHWRPVAGAVALGAAALVLAVALPKGAEKAQSPRVEVVHTELAPEAPTVLADLERSLGESERHYQDSVDELRAMIEDESGIWSDADRQAFAASVARFEDERAGIRALATSSDEHSYDGLWDSYRREVAVLEGALFGDVELLAASAGEQR